MIAGPIDIGGRLVGGDEPTFIVAEIGANHDGNVQRAHELVDVAADAGVDAVKLQTYTSSELLVDDERIITWGPPERCHTEAIGQLFDRLSLPRSAHRELFDHARQRGLIAFSTPFSEDGARFLAGLGAPALKIASSDVSHLALVRAAAEMGVPIILSTGKSTLGEIDAAVATVRDAGAPLILLHCVAQYPAPLDAMQLRLISALAGVYPDCPIGLSDHSIGATACIAAVALGARVLEKHITYDRAAGGPDHWFSADPESLAFLVSEVRALDRALAAVSKAVHPVEAEERRISTRSLVSRQPLPAGVPIAPHDLDALRPGWGIHPSQIDLVVGRTPVADIPARTVLTWDLLR